MTKTDLAIVPDLGLRTVIDLRSTADLGRRGRFTWSTGIAFHHAPLRLPRSLLRPPESKPAKYAMARGRLGVWLH